MKSLKRISKIQTKIKTVLTQMLSVGVVALIALFLIEAPASAFSGSGSGTVANPYQITNATQLQEMKDNFNAHYVLANDIDCSDTVNWNGGAGFEPVGYYDGSHHVFTGTFDGQGYVITGLYINRPSTYFVALFGEFQQYNTIKNVGLVDVDITGGEGGTGALVGYNHYITISNCYSTGSVSGGTSVGGLLSLAFHSTVSNCYSTANVTGTGSHVGGLAGHGCDGTFINCYSTGDVSGDTSVGGLVGGASCEDGEIRNCYSTGNVSGDTYVGGLVGSVGSHNTVSNSYSTGSVTGNSDVGGLVGKNSGTITNSYYDTNTSGQSDTGKGEPKTTAEMMTQFTFVNWDFVNVWGIYEGVIYPYLLWQIVDTTPVDIKPQSCPNLLNVKSKGVLPVAILGTEDFDVTTVDPVSIRLTGVAPLRSSFEDVSTAFYPLLGKESEFDCTEEGPDGFLDLVLKFDTQEVVEALEAELGELADGAVIILPLTGNLLEEYGGTLIIGEDVVIILKKGKK